jgi:predicted nucleotide-binding protein
MPAPRSEPGRRVAIVCRLGQAAREAASGFVAQLGLEPVILRDPPDAGDKTLIERLDRLRDLDYAVVLLAADGPGATPGPQLEIGFLLGVLGRGRICFLLEGKQALLPDLDGVVRHTMDDAGLWRVLLAREMKRAGLNVDLNRAL